jgi:hypothetical protein
MLSGIWGGMRVLSATLLPQAHVLYTRDVWVPMPSQSGTHLFALLNSSSRSSAASTAARVFESCTFLKYESSHFGANNSAIMCQLSCTMQNDLSAFKDVWDASKSVKCRCNRCEETFNY